MTAGSIARSIEPAGRGGHEKPNGAASITAGVYITDGASSPARGGLTSGTLRDVQACPGPHCSLIARFDCRRGNSPPHPTSKLDHMQSDTPPAAESVVSATSPQGGALASEERVLLAAVLKKDRKATAEFVARYADPVYGYVSHRLAPRADLAEDLVQDVFLVALQKLDTFAGQSSVLGWLLGIARHKVEDLYRARLREPEPFSAIGDGSRSDPVALPEFDDVIDRARAQAKTRRILARLPEAYGLALLWRYWEQRSTKEMAAQTGKTEKAIERLLARARAHFRLLWEAGEGP